jgi:glycosyltransferase involved in cell wall biosynthesis
MRILYDGQIYSMQVAGGVNRYFANLIARLPVTYTPCLLVEQQRKINFPVHPNLEVYRCRRLNLRSISYRLHGLYSRLEDYYLKTASTRRPFDVLHPTYYTLLAQQDFGAYRSPVVLTVWDMIHELFTEQDPLGRNAAEKRQAIMAAQVIICISENTKKDLLERYPLSEDRVKVTHLASEIDESISYGAELVPSRPYYLYVGMRFGYKNFAGLLRAFAKVRSARPEAALCVVGTAFNEEEGKLISELKLTDAIEHYGHISDSHLAKLYRLSIAFVYPSLYEGFGIPPLEAMSCGTPVISSNRSSLPEVVGDAGVLFDPASTDDLADIMLHLLDDEAERERLIAKGFQRAKLFSWDKTVAQTLEIYRSVSGRDDLSAAQVA